ncbi:MAG: TRAP transporter small permease subunit [Proteobacteria bacterium]|nr:TRAP transporter small permease subunit [Pseudomonadota bacterium]
MFELIANGIDKFNTKMGETTSLLAIPLLLVVIYEVFMRYVFNTPTVWGFEMTAFLYGIHYMFGIAYTDVTKGHVRVDIFVSRLSPKNQAIVNFITTFFFFLPVFICLVIWTSSFAYTSFIEAERNSTSWAPLIWPYKIIMALTVVFALLQGLSNLIREIQVLRKELKSK